MFSGITVSNHLKNKEGAGLGPVPKPIDRLPRPTVSDVDGDGEADGGPQRVPAAHPLRN